MESRTAPKASRDARVQVSQQQQFFGAFTTFRLVFLMRCLTASRGLRWNVVTIVSCTMIRLIIA
jgi:hypothetical protein